MFSCVEVSCDGGFKMLILGMVKYIWDVFGLVLDFIELGFIFVLKKVELLEDGDFFSVDGVFLRKLFVEKFVSGEDYNIIIYFDKVFGGGVCKFFWKIGNKSFDYIFDLNVFCVIIE